MMGKSKDKDTQNNVEIFIIVCLILMLISSIVLVFGVRENTLTTVSMVNKAEYLEENIQESEGKVIIKYVDESGNEIEESKTITGKVGKEYNIEIKKVEGYILNNVPVNKCGNFDSNDQLVNFIYKKDESTVSTDSTGKAVTVTVYKNKQENLIEYKARIKTVNKNGDVIKGANYKVTNENAQIVRTGTDFTGDFLVGSFVVNDVGTSEYKITEVSSQPGYEKLADSIVLSVIKSAGQDNEDEYVATAQISDMSDVSLEVDKANKEFVITIVKDEEIIVTPTPTPTPTSTPTPTPTPTATPTPTPTPEVTPIITPTPEVTPTPKVTPEPTPTPEPTKEVEKVVEPEEEKIFDLEIDKTIKKVTVKSDGREKVIEKKSKDSLVKVDVPKNKINETDLEVVYTIEVKNVGNVPGYATSITDNIPDGMKLVENEEWKLNDKIATNTKFDATIINPGESITTEITFNMELSENNVGTKENEALITTYYNELGLVDITPDNNAKEPLLITIKTGKKAVITVSALVAVSSFVGLVYKIKEND